MTAYSATQQYQKVCAYSGVMDASPHRLVQMLMEAVLEKIAQAKGNIHRNEIPEKGANISKAILIIEGLRASLNIEEGGELAQNLNDLYDYMERRLLSANQQSDETELDEVFSLMSEIKTGWEAIGVHE